MFTVWIRGLNRRDRLGVAKEVKKLLEVKGLTVIYLDDENSEDVRNAIYVSELLNKQGVIVVASFVSFLGLRTFAKQTIAKYIEVWLKGANRTHVFSSMGCDILVDLKLNSIESCARLVISYLYLHKVLFISKDAKEL